MEAGFAELIVLFTFLGVGEDRIGFGQLLELLLGRFVAGVLVGMVFLGEFAVCFLDFGGFAPLATPSVA